METKYSIDEATLTPERQAKVEERIVDLLNEADFAPNGNVALKSILDECGKAGIGDSEVAMALGGLKKKGLVAMNSKFIVYLTSPKYA